MPNLRAWDHGSPLNISGWTVHACFLFYEGPALIESLSIFPALFWSLNRFPPLLFLLPLSPPFLSRPPTFTCVTSKSLLLASSLNHCMEGRPQQSTPVPQGLTVSPGLCTHVHKIIDIHIILKTHKYINHKENQKFDGREYFHHGPSLQVPT